MRTVSVIKSIEIEEHPFTAYEGVLGILVDGKRLPIHKMDNLYLACSQQVKDTLLSPIDEMGERVMSQKMEILTLTENQKHDQSYIGRVKSASFWARLKYLFTGVIN